jgi:hypothetical protein
MKKKQTAAEADGPSNGDLMNSVPPEFDRHAVAGPSGLCGTSQSTTKRKATSGGKFFALYID